jgi:hypothetical protein
MAAISKATSKIGVVAFSLLVSIAAPWVPGSTFAAGDAKVLSSRATEARLEALERQNQLLDEQNRAIQAQLSAQKTEIETLKQELRGATLPVVGIAQEIPKLKQEVANLESAKNDLPFNVGFRVGWSESPYDMPGGFFYGAYYNHRLLSHEDGIPGGFLSGELMTGWTQGNHATTTGSLLSVLTRQPASSWLDTIEIQPTVQYHLDPGLLGYPSLASLKPYVLAGPGMWITLMSSPIVVSGGPGSRFRHYSADVQGGGVFGAGTELSLSMLRIEPIQRILDKTVVGAEWRHNQFGNGEGFEQYSGSVGFGW